MNDIANAIILGSYHKQDGFHFTQNPYCPVKSNNLYWLWFSGFHSESCIFDIHDKNAPFSETGHGDA